MPPSRIAQVYTSGVTMRSLRFWLTIAGSVLAITTIVIISGVWAEDWSLGLPASADQVTRINTVVAASAYVAAILAVLFALIAYWQASGRPYLEPVITFPGCKPNEMHFELVELRLGSNVPSWINFNHVPFTSDLGLANLPAIEMMKRLAMLKNTGDNLVANVQIRNVLKYSARNPGLRIEFDGLIWSPAYFPEWATVERWHPAFNGAKAIQWDGGTENIIHGQWTRTLPDLNLGEALIFRLQPPPALIVTVVADGCSPRTVTMELGLDIPSKRQGP